MVLGFSLPFFLNFLPNPAQINIVICKVRKLVLAGVPWSPTARNSLSVGEHPAAVRLRPTRWANGVGIAGGRYEGGPTGWALRMGVACGRVSSFLSSSVFLGCCRPASPSARVISRCLSKFCFPGCDGCQAKHHNLHLPFLPLLISFRAHAVPLFSFPHGTVNDAPHAGYPTAADDWMASVIVSRILISKFPKLH